MKRTYQVSILRQADQALALRNASALAALIDEVSYAIRCYDEKYVDANNLVDTYVYLQFALSVLSQSPLGPAQLAAELDKYRDSMGA